jgi:hypothetical protein
MEIGGVYVGLGKGDRSPVIVEAKARMKKLYTPARNTLDDGDMFTPELETEVIREQKIFTQQGREGAPRYVQGIINLEFKYDLGLLKRPKPDRVLPIIFTVEGHMSNMFFGPCADTARALEQQGVCHWKPIYYKNDDLPFKNSLGVAAMLATIGAPMVEGPPVDPNNPDGPKVMWPNPPGNYIGIVAFSQGAAVACEFMWKHVLPSGGALHGRLGDMRRFLMFGNPRRAKDAVCAWAQSPPGEGTHGIMDKLFDANKEGVGDRWAEHPNDNDLFAEVDDDEAGQMQTAVAKIVVENGWGGPAGIWVRVLKIFKNPIGGVYNALKAAFDAIMFLATNPNPHYTTFATPGDVEWMRGVAA